MDLRLVEKRRGPEEDCYSWQRFELREQFNRAWWNDLRLFDANAIYYEVRRGDVEVARVELDDHADFAHGFGGPKLGTSGLEIQFIEVAPEFRGGHVGTETIGLLNVAHPGRRLMALSERADGFWASLGWDRYPHPEHAEGRPLYVQPE